MENQYIQVFVSCASREEAKSLVDALLNDQIIACAQILPGIESFYRWQGQTERAEECLLLLKSQSDKFPAIERTIKALHSYDVPEILAMPVTAGSTAYLKWINEQIK